MVQWIRPRTSNGEDPGSNLLTAAVVSLGNVRYHHCLVPRKVLKVAGPPGSGNLLINMQLCGHAGKINPSYTTKSISCSGKGGTSNWDSNWTLEVYFVFNRRYTRYNVNIMRNTVDD